MYHKPLFATELIFCHNPKSNSKIPSQTLQPYTYHSAVISASYCKRWQLIGTDLKTKLKKIIKVFIFVFMSEQHLYLKQLKV